MCFTFLAFNSFPTALKTVIFTLTRCHPLWAPDRTGLVDGGRQKSRDKTLITLSFGSILDVRSARDEQLGSRKCADLTVPSAGFITLHLHVARPEAAGKCNGASASSHNPLPRIIPPLDDFTHHLVSQPHLLEHKSAGKSIRLTCRIEWKR
jgi:hypothetical protein